MKKVKASAEREAHEKEKLAKRNFRYEFTKAKRTIILICRDKGLRTAEVQLEYAKKARNLLPVSGLSAEQTIDAWEQGIREHKENIYQ